MEQLKILDLFSGLGGFSLGLERTGKFKTVAFCEIDKYCTLLLQKHWKGVKIYEDVRKINKEQFDTDGIEYPDIITGGFPCQPFSVAGKQKGTGDDRHLIIKTFKPKFVIGENVKGLINIQDGVVFETVCTDLESEGYEVQAFNIPAAGVGAPHRRERIWILATNVANSISDNEREQITRGDEEERRIQEEYRQDNSTTRQSSRTSAIRNGDRGYDVANPSSEQSHSNDKRTRTERN
jgi:DNA (cytosine-5)-methyltransferase 1